MEDIAPIPGRDVRLDRLDHLRLLACLMVMIWHFTHAYVPPSAVPRLSLLSVFEEGHVGVSLFCVISGFILTWIYGERTIIYSGFLLNRALRILPLFVLWLVLSFMVTEWDAAKLLVVVLTSLNRGELPSYIGSGWSILVEIQFYLIFPVLIFFLRKYGLVYLIGLLGFFVAIRFFVWAERGYVQDLSYWTIFGRLDQFLTGMIGGAVCRKHDTRRLNTQLGLAMLTFGSLAILLVYAQFNQAGGWYAYGNEYPSRSLFWVFLPTIEAACFGFIVVGYIASPSRNTDTVASNCFSYLGRISYSMYMCHVAVLFAVIRNTQHIYKPHTWEAATVLFFIAGLPVVVGFATASYYLIEKPFMDLRRPRA